MSDVVREEFIKAFELAKGYKPIEEEFGEGFSSPYEDGAWWAWQASRASIRVDLPHLFPFYREGVTEALLAHGIKVNQWGSK